ncbi:hypothetical protein Lal_00007631 [Lupinus albus]|nr:hypothetical protein Lal_00007631 [Lupinus albus]
MSGTSDGASLRKQIKKMEVSEHIKIFCEFCGKVKPNFLLWIWGCKDCGRVKAGCAYTLNSDQVEPMQVITGYMSWLNRLKPTLTALDTCKHLMR